MGKNAKLRQSRLKGISEVTEELGAAFDRSNHVNLVIGDNSLVPEDIFRAVHKEYAEINQRKGRVNKNFWMTTPDHPEAICCDYDHFVARAKQVGEYQKMPTGWFEGISELIQKEDQPVVLWTTQDKTIPLVLSPLETTVFA